MAKEKAFAQSMLQQTNDVLDAIEGKKSIIEVTSFMGVQYVDVTKIRDRIHQLRRKDVVKPEQPNVDEPKSPKQKAGKEKAKGKGKK
jgi:hypothetical protein